MSGPRLFLCTDLDRTALPNGPQPESPRARSLFARLASREGVTLTYVTGRHRKLVERAIANYGLPQPAFAITDVGTKIHAREDGVWHLWPDWEDEIDRDWAGYDHAGISQLFRDLKPLRLQELAKQSLHKLSYYLPVQAHSPALHEEMQGRLRERGIRASLVWSVDEPAGVGLLDVLPERATKLHAVEFLRECIGVSLDRTLFAGDSGNDLQVMASAVPSVLVANAADHVKASALEQARAAGNDHTLYIARGGYLGMNGNYSAGILEGVVHFMPELAEWIENG
jgi:HAD superfamily hydrolase (TIGR01484 family)